MRWGARPGSGNGYGWIFRKATDSQRCHVFRSIRHSSWFTNSLLTLLQVMLLTYYIVRRVSARTVRIDLQDHTIADWTQFCRKVIMEYIA
jgi:hypothetical protein